VYSREFDTDIGREYVRQAFELFHIRTENPRLSNVTYGYEGLIRRTDHDTATLGRNSLVHTRSELFGRIQGNTYQFRLQAVDGLLRNFTFRARELYAILGTGGPFLMRAAIVTPLVLIAMGPDGPFQRQEGSVDPGRYDFGTMQVTDINSPFEQIIRAFCDQAYQMFDQPRSPFF
jgi:hypothetical protein